MYNYRDPEVNNGYRNGSSLTCQVPMLSCPFVIGIVTEQPNIDDFMCAGMSSGPVIDYTI